MGIPHTPLAVRDYCKGVSLSSSLGSYALCLVHFEVGPIVGGWSKVGEEKSVPIVCPVPSYSSYKTFLSIVILTWEHQSPFFGQFTVDDTSHPL